MKRTDVQVLSRTALYDGVLKLIDLKYQAPNFSGAPSAPVSREVLCAPTPPPRWCTTSRAM